MRGRLIELGCVTNTTPWATLHIGDNGGLTYDEASLALEQFVSSSLDQGLHCVRIVHGKGLRSGATGPVIKPLVDQWLRGCSGVLAFASARPADGGTGAVNVLLKTRK